MDNKSLSSDSNITYQLLYDELFNNYSMMIYIQ